MNDGFDEKQSRGIFVLNMLYTKLYAIVTKIMAPIADLDRQCSEAELIQRLVSYITKATDFDSKAI